MPSPQPTPVPSEAAARVRRNTFILAMAAGLAGLMFGLDTGVIAGALTFIKEAFSADDRTLEWIVSSLMAAAAVGSVLAVFIADKWGAKARWSLLESCSSEARPSAHWPPVCRS